MAAAFGSPVVEHRHRLEDLPTVVAGASDLAAVPRGQPVALLSHGADQTYVGLAHPSYAGGAGRERVSLFLVPRQESAYVNLARYPDASAVVVGCPALDQHVHREPPEGRPTVGVSFHWTPASLARSVPELRSAFDHYRDALPDIVAGLRAAGLRPVGHWHPRFRPLRRLWDRLGVETVEDWDRLLPRLSCLVVDNSSVGWECQAVGVPTVWLDAPWFRRGVEHGLRFWEHAHLRASGPGEVVAVVEAALSGVGPSPREVAAEVYGVPVGEATGVAVAALQEWLESF